MGALITLVHILVNEWLKASEPIQVNVNWDPNYVEHVDLYEEYNANYEDWEVYTPEDCDVYTSVTIDPAVSYTPTEIFVAEIDQRTVKDEQLIMLSESEAWSLLSNGIFTDYPTSSFKSIKSDIISIQETNTETITVRVWYWANPKDESDMSKVTRTKTFAVNSAIADLFVHIFEDIYNHPSRPVINLADGGMGTWVLRGKNHNDNNTLSSHSIGAAIDINPSTGSFYVNNVWYGNAYGQKAMPYNIWCQLPECHKKYHVLYQDCPIVQIFKSYGFYWGGDWKTGTDCMHLAFIGDGKSARATGQSNYKNYS